MNGILNRLNQLPLELSRYLAALVAVMLSGLVSPYGGALAVTMELYTATVPMDSQDPNPRDAAYRAALDLVLVQVTGSDDERHRETLGEIFPNPGRYVLRFRPASDDTLEVTFDADAIERVLRQNKQTIWDADRPLTLVWLAVDWGDGQREIISADDALQSGDSTRSIDRNRLLRDRVQKVAERRGIPVAFPLLDAQDLGIVSFSDIWGGFNDPLVEASRRYGTSSILVGRVRPDTIQQNQWTYLLGGAQLVWNGEPEEVVNSLADQLAAELAVSGDAELEAFRVQISGIDSVVAYGEVDRMMRELGVLERHDLRLVEGDRLEYHVNIYGGVDRLNRALELSGVVQPQIVIDSFGATSVADPDLLTFQYMQ